MKTGTKTCLEQWMKMAAFNWLTFSTEVVLFKFQFLPVTPSKEQATYVD